MESKGAFTDDQISDNIFGVFLVTGDSTVCVISWSVKYLRENSSILKVAIEEQEEAIDLKISRVGKKFNVGRHKIDAIYSWSDSRNHESSKNS